MADEIQIDGSQPDRIDRPPVDEINIAQEELTPEKLAGVQTRDPEQTKEEAASRVAHLVVVFFGAFLLALFLGGVAALSLGVFVDWKLAEGAMAQGDALPATKALLQSYAGMVEGIGKAGTTLFGPLLGFILGHYFGRKSSGSGA